MPRKKLESTISFKGWFIFKRKAKNGYNFYARPKGKTSKISLHTTDFKQAKLNLEKIISQSEQDFSSYTTVGELLDDWRNSIEKRGNCTDRLDYRIKRLKSFFGNLDADQFTHVDSYSYVEEYRNRHQFYNVKASTLSRDLTDLSASLNFAFGNRNPHTGELKDPKLKSAPIIIRQILPKRRRERIFTDEEIESLVNNAYDVSKGIHLAILISMTMAARRAACLDLTKDRVKDGVIDFNNPDLKGRRKGRAINKIPTALMPYIQDALLNNKSKYICEHDGRGMTSNIADKLFNKARVNAGLYEPHLPVLDRLSFHNLRHHCLTNLAKNDVTMFKIAKLAGHSTSLITEKVYSHLNPRHQTKESEISSKMLLKTKRPKVVVNSKHNQMVGN